VKQLKETHAMRLYLLPRFSKLSVKQPKETHAMRLYLQNKEVR